MDEILQLNPKSIETGIPMTLSVKEGLLPSGGRTLMIYHEGSEPISAELVKGPAGTWVSQFALYEPGQYRAQLGSIEKNFTVLPRKDISFFLEIGVLTLSVTSFLGGLIIWSWKNRNKKVGSSSSAGPS